MTDPIRLDLVSDTATCPTPDMRRAIADADVGDEQRGEDPSINALTERVASLLGKEAAIFVPSGIMSNVIAILVHCRPGDEIIAAENAHIIGAEAAAASALAGASIQPIACEFGIFSGWDVEAAVRKTRYRSPRSRLINIEQTTNRGGGSVWPLDTIASVAKAGHAHNLSLHMDGARLLNAVIATDVSADAYAAPFDSCWLDLSKGLGCPAGSVLAGSRAFIEDAWWWKHRLGGAMRQSGILAAAGLYALDHHVDRLADDHENARQLAERLRNIPGIDVMTPNIQTNLVFFNLMGTGFTADEISNRLLKEGIRIGIEQEFRMRAVTHLDISLKDVHEAADHLERIIGLENAHPRAANERVQRS